MIPFINAKLGSYNPPSFPLDNTYFYPLNPPLIKPDFATSPLNKSKPWTPSITFSCGASWLDLPDLPGLVWGKNKWKLIPKNLQRLENTKNGLLLWPHGLWGKKNMRPAVRGLYKFEFVYSDSFPFHLPKFLQKRIPSAPIAEAGILSFFLPHGKR